MKLKQLKTVLALVATLAVAPSFAGDALYDPASNNQEITLAAVGIVNEAEVQFERICESETVGNSICVLCEYTAIGETSYNCYKIPDSGSTNGGGKRINTIKMAN